MSEQACRLKAALHFRRYDWLAALGLALLLGLGTCQPTHHAYIPAGVEVSP